MKIEKAVFKKVVALLENGKDWEFTSWLNSPIDQTKVKDLRSFERYSHISGIGIIKVYSLMFAFDTLVFKVVASDDVSKQVTLSLLQSLKIRRILKKKIKQSVKALEVDHNYAIVELLDKA